MLKCCTLLWCSTPSRGMCSKICVKIIYFVVVVVDRSMGKCVNIFGCWKRLSVDSFKITIRIGGKGRERRKKSVGQFIFGDFIKTIGSDFASVITFCTQLGKLLSPHSDTCINSRLHFYVFLWASECAMVGFCAAKRKYVHPLSLSLARSVCCDHSFRAAIRCTMAVSSSSTPLAVDSNGMDFIGLAWLGFGRIFGMKYLWRRCATIFHSWNCVMTTVGICCVLCYGLFSVATWIMYTRNRAFALILRDVKYISLFKLFDWEKIPS